MQSIFIRSIQTEEWMYLGIIMGSVSLLAFVVYPIVTKFAEKASKRTATELDDLLLQKLKSPVKALIIFGGLWFSLVRLPFNPEMQDFANASMQVVITLVLTWALARFLSSLIKQYMVPLLEKSESDSWSHVTPMVSKIVSLVIWILGIIMATDNAGFDIGAMLAGLGIGGVAVALASKDYITNIFGGLTIMTDKPFKIGDIVEVAGFTGTITDIGLRSTRLKTFEGRMVTIPNSKFTDSTIENWSSEPSRRVLLNLGLTYSTPPEKMDRALEVLREIIAHDESTDEKVITGFTAFNDSALNILFIYYILKDEDILAVQNKINNEILKRFNVEGLEFAYPTQTLFTNITKE